MRIFKFFVVLSVVITICYFSWSNYTGRSLKKKHERATLVFEECCNGSKIAGLERFYA